MKVLVLDSNVRYMNPMRNLLPYYLSLIGDVTFYGPGYCSSEIIKSGVNKFIDEHGPFDVTIKTIQAFTAKFNQNFKEWTKFFKRSFNYDFSDDDLISFWMDYGKSDKISSYDVALLHQLDFQIISSEFCEHLLSNYNLIVGLGKDFWMSVDRIQKEDLIGYGDVNNNWYELIKHNPNRVVGLMNFVCGSEFDFSPLTLRDGNWSILGASYSKRVEARAILDKYDIKYNDGKSLRIQTMKLMNKLGLNVFSRKSNLETLNKIFSSAMKHSKFSYTCGSSFRFPIRKYFEIPASGALLVCDRCEGFEKLGFIDKKNSIVCLPEDLPDLSQELHANLDYAQELASSGQKLVLEKHTVDIRASQLRNTIELGLSGGYQGSYWDAGELKFL